MRIAVAGLSLLIMIGLAPLTTAAQETAVRFPVADVSDTTFTFRIEDARWVRAGLRGIVVDPREQDMLVARFRIARVTAGTARAVVTGQTTSVTPQHTVLIEVPPTPWYRRPDFWLGTAVGAVTGFLLGKV